MPFVDTNSHLTTKPFNSTSSVKAILKGMTDTVFWDQVSGWKKKVFLVGDFSNKKEHSGADWLDFLLALS